MAAEATDNTCYFWRLPRELRDEIYLLTTHLRQRHANDNRRRTVRPRRMMNDPNKSTLRQIGRRFGFDISNQYLTEAPPIFLRTITFDFWGLQDFERFISLSPMVKKNITFFSYYHENRDPIEGRIPDLINTCPRLKHVNVDFYTGCLCGCGARFDDGTVEFRCCECDALEGSVRSPAGFEDWLRDILQHFREFRELETFRLDTAISEPWWANGHWECSEVVSTEFKQLVTQRRDVAAHDDGLRQADIAGGER